MNPIITGNKPSHVQALEILRERLKTKYALASYRQHVGIRPSGYMCGMQEALKELDDLLEETKGWESANTMCMSVMESQSSIGSGVTFQRWFIRLGTNITRTELYLLEDGSVVAFQDCVNGVTEPLHMDGFFKDLYDGEAALDAILRHSGVLDKSKIKPYFTGR